MKPGSCLISIFSALTLGSSFCAIADDTDVSADVRCIVVGSQLALSPDASLRNRAGMLLMYYLGRFDGRALPYSLERSLATEANKMTSAGLQAETRRCSDALAAKGQEIIKIGEDLSRLGK
jgi:hypothetical protein